MGKYNAIAGFIKYHVNKYPRAGGIIKYHVNKSLRMGYVRMHIWWCFKQIDVELTNCYFVNQYKWFVWMFIDFRVPPPPPRGLCACRRRFFPSKSTPLDFMNMCFIHFVTFKRFQGPLVKFSKYGRSAQMTMPARHASEFCAKRRALLLLIFFLSLIC